MVLYVVVDFVIDEVILFLLKGDILIEVGNLYYKEFIC